MYGVYHGSKGIKHIAVKIHGFAKLLNRGLKFLGFNQVNDIYFDTLRVECDSALADKIKTIAEVNQANLRYFESGDLGITK